MITQPTRTCVGCRGRSGKADLLRVVLIGTACVPDAAARLPGRGAYLHRDSDCFALAVRRRALVRALRAPAGVDVTAVEDELTAGRPGEPPTVHRPVGSTRMNTR